MASIKEIAKECKVSIATVSNVINNKPGVGEETKKRILQTIRELDYTPNVIAKNLKQKNSRTIGIITEDLTVFNSAWVVDGINEYCDDRDYQFVLGNLRLYRKYDKKFYTSNKYYNHVIDEFKMMQSKKVEGIVYIGCHCRELTCIPNDFTLPIVTAYSFTNNEKIPAVIFDDEQGSYESVTTLIKAGHTKIGVICGLSESIHTQQRLRGYQRALYDNRMLYNPEFICYGDWDKKSGYEASEILLDKGVTAIFAMNDVMAGGVYDFLNKENLKVGKDISLVGFDNREISQAYNPPLSTMELPLFEIGRKSAEILIDMIQKNNTKKIKENYKINCKLVERESICKIEN